MSAWVVSLEASLLGLRMESSLCVLTWSDLYVNIPHTSVSIPNSYKEASQIGLHQFNYLLRGHISKYSDNRG